MANAMDYLAWRGDLPFETDPANEVDYFLCSQLSTPCYTGIADETPVTVADAAAAYFSCHTEDVSNLGVLQSTEVLPMLHTMAATPRYRNVILRDYANIVRPENNEQFCAVTIDLTDGTRVVSFRGTDDTITGWREDFDIAVCESVPAQQDAVDYLNRAAGTFCGDVVVVGHSKGGNLAVYAAANAAQNVSYRIRAVYSFDGPGFLDAFLASENYLAIKDITTTVMSQHSIVGVLMKLAGTAEIVKSTVAGPMAHDGFNWQVLGTKFIRLPELSAASRAYEEAADSMVFGMDREDLKAFIDELFDTLDSTGAATIAEMTKMKPAAHLELVRALLKGRRVNSFASEFIEKMMKALFQKQTED